MPELPTGIAPAVECGQLKRGIAMGELDGHFAMQFATMTALAFYGLFFWNQLVWAIAMGIILTLGFGFFISRFILNLEGPPAKLAISSIACGTSVMLALWLAYHFSI